MYSTLDFFFESFPDTVAGKLHWYSVGVVWVWCGTVLVWYSVGVVQCRCGTVLEWSGVGRLVCAGTAPLAGGALAEY